jgi:hypothetical protein
MSILGPLAFQLAKAWLRKRQPVLYLVAGVSEVTPKWFFFFSLSALLAHRIRLPAQSLLSTRSQHSASIEPEPELQTSPEPTRQRPTSGAWVKVWHHVPHPVCHALGGAIPASQRCSFHLRVLSINLPLGSSGPLNVTVATVARGQASSPHRSDGALDAQPHSHHPLFWPRGGRDCYSTLPILPPLLRYLPSSVPDAGDRPGPGSRWMPVAR